MNMSCHYGNFARFELYIPATRFAAAERASGSPDSKTNFSHSDGNGRAYD
jgi:hypothetical protein